MKAGKRMKEARGKIDRAKIYSLTEAVALIKETSQIKFDASVEIHARLGIDPKKSDQLVRAAVSFPHGTGKTIRVAAFVPDDQHASAQSAGADIVGSDELIEKIRTTNVCDFDIAVATPDMMKKLASVARILGQKGLMPNPKTGTIAPDVTKIIGELKKGKVSYKNDDAGNVHVVAGKVSFDEKKLIENIEAFLDSLKRAKPQGIKGTFIQGVYLTTSMGPSVKMAVN